MSLEGRLDVAVDDAAEFTFTVSNGDVGPVEFTLRSGLVAEMVVYDERDSEVWRRSEGQMYTQALQDARLAPGESFAETARWADPSPGRYTAVASLDAVDVDLEARARFDV